MRVVVVPVLSDNYAYLLIDDSKKIAACVDPAEAHLVLAKAKEEGVQIVAVLTTHHHYDHAGGNQEMVKQVPGIKVYGGRIDNVAACTDALEHADKFNVGAIEVCALHTPGHTRGSICYHCYDAPDKQGLVFTGDTLFVAGCGRMFESTPEEFYNSLVHVLGALPPDTQVYVGHEYTVKNLQFAAAVETSNKNLQQMLEWAQEQKVQRKFTVPSTMRNEWLINPFLRSADDSMRTPMLIKNNSCKMNSTSGLVKRNSTEEDCLSEKCSVGVAPTFEEIQITSLAPLLWRAVVIRDEAKQPVGFVFGNREEARCSWI